MPQFTYVVHNEEAKELKRIRERDPGALAELIVEHGKSVYRLAYRLLNNIGSKEDIEECTSLDYRRKLSGRLRTDNIFYHRFLVHSPIASIAGLLDLTPSDSE